MKMLSYNLCFSIPKNSVDQIKKKFPGSTGSQYTADSELFTITYRFEMNNWDKNRIDCINKAIGLKMHCINTKLIEIPFDSYQPANNIFSLFICSTYYPKFYRRPSIEQVMDLNYHIEQEKNITTVVYKGLQKSRLLYKFRQELLVLENNNIPYTDKAVLEKNYAGESFRVLDRNLKLIN